MFIDIYPPIIYTMCCHRCTAGCREAPRARPSSTPAAPRAPAPTSATRCVRGGICGTQPCERRVRYPAHPWYLCQVMTMVGLSLYHDNRGCGALVRNPFGALHPASARCTCGVGRPRAPALMPATRRARVCTCTRAPRRQRCSECSSAAERAASGQLQQGSEGRASEHFTPL